MDRRGPHPIDFGAYLCKFAALAGERETPSGPIPFAALLKGEIVDEAASARNLRHLRDLIGRRVEAEHCGLAANHRHILALARQWCSVVAQLLRRLVWRRADQHHPPIHPTTTYTGLELIPAQTRFELISGLPAQDSGEKKSRSRKGLSDMIGNTALGPFPARA